MAGELIGLIVGVQTNRVYSVVNPDDDADLDSPHHLQLGNLHNEPVRMVKIRRDHYHHPDNEVSPINCEYGVPMTEGDVFHLISRWYVETSATYTGAEHINRVGDMPLP